MFAWFVFFLFGMQTKPHRRSCTNLFIVHHWMTATIPSHMNSAELELWLSQIYFGDLISDLSSRRIFFCSSNFSFCDVTHKFCRQRWEYRLPLTTSVHASVFATPPLYSFKTLIRARRKSVEYTYCLCIWYFFVFWTCIDGGEFCLDSRQSNNLQTKQFSWDNTKTFQVHQSNSHKHKFCNLVSVSFAISRFKCCRFWVCARLCCLMASFFNR